MFLDYSELLNALDTGATTKITINNKRVNKVDFEHSILLPQKGDTLDGFRREYNEMLLSKVSGASNSVAQERYVTVSVQKKNIEEARTFFARVTGDITTRLSKLGSHSQELKANARLRIFHDFYRVGEEAAYRFSLRKAMRKGDRMYTNAAGQAKYCYDRGLTVGESELLPGDLVFWQNLRCIGCHRWEEVHHTGIYIGGGKVIEASSGKGRVVIRDLWSTENYPIYLFGRPY